MDTPVGISTLCGYNKCTLFHISIHTQNPMKSSEAPTVAYLRYADKYCGPLLCRLKGVNQSVIRSHSEFSPRLVENLSCLYAIEVPKVGCILPEPTLRCLQPKDKP